MELCTKWAVHQESQPCLNRGCPGFGECEQDGGAAELPTQ